MGLIQREGKGNFFVGEMGDEPIFSGSFRMSYIATHHSSSKIPVLFFVFATSNYIEEKKVHLGVNPRFIISKSRDANHYGIQ